MRVMPWEGELTALLGVNARALKVYRSDEQPVTGKCICIYGRAGVGKTEAAVQAADSEFGAPVIYLNVEGGAWVFGHRSDIVVVDILRYEDFSTFVVALSKVRNAESLPFRTIVVDNASELQAMNVASIMGSTGSVGIAGTAMPTQQQWGASTAQILNALRACHDSSRRLGINWIFTAWEDYGKDDGDVAPRRGIGFTPALARGFPGIVDIVGHLSVKNDPPHYTRVLNFASSPISDAKFRRKRGEAAMKVPLSINYRQQPVIKHLLDTIIGGRDWPDKEYAALRQQATVAQPAQASHATQAQAQNAHPQLHQPGAATNDAGPVDMSVIPDSLNNDTQPTDQ